MNPSRKVTLNHKTAEGDIEQIEVKMLYCAAAESGYQILSGKTMEVFIPEMKQQEDGTYIVAKQATATDMDYMQLSMAAINAAYEADNQETPITANDIMYHCTREQVINLVGVVMELYREWLKIPSTLGKEMKDEEGKGRRKNAETRSKRTKQ